MGRKKLRSGGEEISNAKVLFDASRAKGHADFRYVALAIGASPAAPPLWALMECFMECLRTEKLAGSEASLEQGTVDLVIEEMARQLALAHFAPELSPEISPDSKLSKTELVHRACRALGVNLEHLDYRADTDWMRSILRAWDREQLAPLPYDYWEFPGFKLTHRIDRVTTAIVGKLEGLPTSPEKALWVLAVLNSGNVPDN